MHDDWHPVFERERSKEYFGALTEFVAAQRRLHEVYPAEPDVFAAFEMTPLSRVKVVILGQDPYHGPGQAHGLAFSVRDAPAIPASLRNIFTELSSDLGIAPPPHGNLSAWAEQGVLLLNTTLTVRRGEPLSHSGKGWERFTTEMLRAVDATAEPCVFVLWGAKAQAARRLIDTTVHHVIEAPHPSPLSAHRGFLGSRPFSTINAALAASGRGPIDWRLE